MLFVDNLFFGGWQPSPAPIGLFNFCEELTVETLNLQTCLFYKLFFSILQAFTPILATGARGR